MEQDNNNNNTPSTGSDVMPGGGSNIGQAATQGAKNVARKSWKSIKEGVGRGLRAVWALMPMTVKIIVIVVLFILIIIAALLMMGMVSESTNVTSSNVDNYIADANDLDEEAKSLYDEKSSLIKMKLSDIDKIYNKFVSEDKGGAETQTLMQHKIGTNDVAKDKENERIVNIDDKLPLYKHILLTEKYNFNNINWQKFSHNATAGNKVDKFKEDKELGLKYPDDPKNKGGVKKFIDLTLPYLQSWYIPLSMSNASIVSGTEEDSSRAPAFSYNIIKEAYSNIVVNWYELKKYTLKTKYYTYDRIEKQDVLSNVEVQESVYADGSKSYSLNIGKVTTSEVARTSHNTSTKDGSSDGIKAPMREEHISHSEEYTSHYYIKQADVFDAKIINEFNYQIYSDNDANNRINADFTTEEKARYSKEAENVVNMYENAEITCDDNGNLVVNNKIVKHKGEISSTKSDPSNTATKINIYNLGNINLDKYVVYDNEEEHTVTRIWQDKLSQSSSQTSNYTIDDLILYNQSDARKEKVTGMDLCGTSQVTSYNINTGTSNSAASIKIGSYTYPVFNQLDYTQTTKHGGQTIAQAGCGLCCLTTVVGGITNKNVDPISCGNDTNWNQPKSLSQISDDLTKVYSINTEVVRWDNKNSGPSVSEKEKISKQKIVDALQNNNPVIALIKPNEAVLGTSADGAHYVTLVGIEGDKVIIANSAGGKKEEYNIDFVIENIYVGADKSECGFVIAKRSGVASSTSSNNSSSSTSSTDNSSFNISTGTGQAKITSSNVNSTGYTGTFTSGTTGRTFKEYKQNGNTFIGNYDISSVGCSWSSECGTVSIMIIGSGYSDKATFADATNKLKSNSGKTTFVPWLSDYAKDAQVKEISPPSKDKLKQILSDGNVAVIHDPAYSEAGHYMAILDISQDKTQIYISNPDTSNNIQNGWNPINIFYSGGQYIDEFYIISNKGEVTQYSEGNSSSDTYDTTCTGTKSGKYYTNLKNTDGLNRIDFMNSNPDIFHRYIREGAEYYEYVGYSRSKLTLSYWNLKNVFNNVTQKNSGTLPFVYGKTLGFDNIYSSSNQSNNSSIGGGLFTWPVPEYVKAGLGMWEQITSTFGNRTHPLTGQPGTMHNGIDIAAGVNGSAEIFAAASGTVVKAGDSGDGYGVCVIIQHSSGYYTLYGHMATGSLKVSVGDTVSSAQQIGIMGSTGNSTGNHLHFEVTKIDDEFSMSKYYSSTRLDPVDFFDEDCKPIGGGLASQDVVNFVWEWEGSDEYLKAIGALTADGKDYIIIRDEVAGTRAVGHGIDLDAGGYASVFEDAGYPTSVGSRIPKSFVDELSKKNIEDRRNEIVAKVSGINLKDYQIDALVSRSYQMGASGWYYGDTWSYAPGETFVSAYKKWWKDSDNSSQVNYNHPLYTNFMQYVTNGGVSGLVARRKSEWKLFQTGIYDASH